MCGDIGTSPLHAVKECFSPTHGSAVTQENVLGVLSLFGWALILVIVLEYLSFVMRADNRGEGGTFALLALMDPKKAERARGGAALVLLGIFGASLLSGEGMITPAISVLGAVEGLKEATDVFEPYVVYISVGIIVALFLIQKRGTGSVGAIFGPMMLVWFVTIIATAEPWIANARARRSARAQLAHQRHELRPRPRDAHHHGPPRHGSLTQGALRVPEPERASGERVLPDTAEPGGRAGYPDRAVTRRARRTRGGPRPDKVPTSPNHR